MSGWRRGWWLVAAVAGLHVLGFAILLGLVVPHGHRVQGGGAVFGLGLGLTAYTLGMRHAFDVDHIAAIDNATRRLMADGQRPLSVGFWFALGHSSVVMALGVVVALGVRGIGGAVEDDGSALNQVTGLVGPLVSGTFLLVIGLLNLAVLAGIVGALRRARRGEAAAADAAARLQPGGLMTRVLGRALRAVRRPWHMYPLGVLFGLGFDTATEVALLILAGGAAAGGLPVWAVLCLPVLFAAGMTLFDTIDGAFMHVAYGWALGEPVRRLYYNVVVTGLSVAVALLVGGLQLLGVLADRLALHGAFWDAVAGVDLDVVGYGLAGLFVAAWAVALTAWRLGGRTAPEAGARG